MPLHLLKLVSQLSYEALTATVVLLMGTMLGYKFAVVPGNPFRLLARVWFAVVAGPLLHARTWFTRTRIIAANNSLSCLLLVVAGTGAGQIGGWLALALVGGGLGTGLRGLRAVPMAVAPPSPETRRFYIAGLLMNLLEIPAIILCAAIGLAGGALTSELTLQEGLGLFAWIAFPLLLVAAAGEGLWMHLCDVHLFLYEELEPGDGGDTPAASRDEEASNTNQEASASDADGADD